MSLRVRRRLTFANVVSLTALFVALGGTSYAALVITGKNVKNSSLTGADLRNESLTSGDVKNGSLLTRDFKAGQLPHLTPASSRSGPAGPKGDTGVSGPAGPKGDRGDVGPTTGFPGSNTDVAPSATPELTMTTRTFTLPSAGSLYLHSTGNVWLNCSPSTSQPLIGLYVDGQPVTGGTVGFPKIVWTTVNLTAVTGTLSAGSHTVTTRADCIGGGVTPDSGFYPGNITAILLGG